MFSVSGTIRHDHFVVGCFQPRLYLALRSSCRTRISYASMQRNQIRCAMQRGNRGSRPPRVLDSSNHHLQERADGEVFYISVADDTLHLKLLDPFLFAFIAFPPQARDDTQYLDAYTLHLHHV